MSAHLLGVRNYPVLIFATMAAFLGAGTSFADQIFFTNLVQPGNQYGPDGLGIGHTPSFTLGETGEVLGATGFTPTTTFQLTDIDIALGYAGTGPNQADVFLVSDSGGLPGSTIESWVLTNLPSAGGPSPLTLVPSSSDPILLAGQQYWVVATGGLDTFDSWSFTLSGDTFSPLAIEDIVNGINSGWELNSSGRQGALVVYGNAVPEPNSVASTSLALLSLFIVLQRRRARSTR